MDTVEQAGQAAEEVCREVQATGSLTPVYSALEDALRRYAEEGGALDEVLPGGDDGSLGFSRRRPNGPGFWRRYVDVLRGELCSPDGELHTAVSHGLATSGASLITVIIATLGLPLAAAPVVAPVAGAILALGLKAMCEEQGEPDSDASASSTDGTLARTGETD